MAVLLELGPELDEHGGAEDDGAEDDGVRDHGAVDHRHLGQEEPRLDELDDHGQVILRRREGANRQRAGRTRLGGQRAPLRTAPAMIQRAGDGATADHLRVGPGSKAVGQGQRVARKLWQVGRGTGLCRWRWRGPTCVDSGARACFAYRPSNHRDNHESLHRNGGQGSARIECRGAGAQSRVTFARRACARVRAWKAYVCACVCAR